MQDPDPMEKRRAIHSLCDFAFDSRRVASKEFSSVVPYLKTACEDENVTVRTAAARCLGTVTATAAGRRAFGQNDFYKEIMNLIEDEDATVRHAANVVLQRLVLSPIAAEELVAAGASSMLVERIPKEADDILEILLQTIHSCCLVDSEAVLLSNGLEFVVPLLKSPNPEVKERAATVIKELTVEAKGRNKALELSTLPYLLDLFSDEDERVQAKALSAVMMIANATPAKFLALERNAIEKLIPFLKSQNTEIRLNAVKVLTALSEAPPGKKILLFHFQTRIGELLVFVSGDNPERKMIVTRLLNDRVKEIQRAAKKLISIIAS